MINTEIRTSIGNSTTYNPAKDNKTYWNYLALAYEIAGVEIDGKIIIPELRKIRREFGLETENKAKENSSKNRKNKKKTSYTNIVIKNIETGEIKNYKDTREAAEGLNVHISRISNYIRSNCRIKRIYEIVSYDSEDYVQRASRNFSDGIFITNTETNEVNRFETCNEAAKFLKVAPCTVSLAAREHRKISRKYICEYRGTRK